MNYYPNYVKKGDRITASGYNDLVKAVRGEPVSTKDKAFLRKKNFRPFDPISLYNRDDEFYMILKEGVYFLFSNIGNQIKVKEDVKVNGVTVTEADLEEYPEIKVQRDKNLYFNLEREELIWETGDLEGNIKVLEFEWESDGSGFEVVNCICNNIDFTKLPPFFPIHCQKEEEHKVAVIPGNVSEIIPHGGDAFFSREVAEVLDGGKLKFHTITSGQSGFVKINTDERGLIAIEGEGNAVEFEVNQSSTESVHYQPQIADDSSGDRGVYYIKLFEYSGVEIDVVHTGNIQWIRDIIRVDNVGNPAPENGGRVVKEYNRDEYKYYLRNIVEGGPQIQVEETADTIDIKGNDVTSDLKVQNGEGSPETVLSWEDGLVTTPEENTIMIPEYLAGDNITIDDNANNTYTINANFDSLSGGNLKISHTIVTYDSVNNAFFPTGSPTFFYFKNGLYTGTTSPFGVGEPFDELDIASPEVS